MENKITVKRMVNGFLASIKEGILVCKRLFPMIISVIVFVKILTELNLLEYVAMPLAPVMESMGLPAEFGLVWAAAMIVNIYSSLVLIPTILTMVPVVTVEQMTILGLIILIAHSLILETRIVGQCGLSMTVQVVLRLVSAWIAGLFIHIMCLNFGFWQEPATVIFEAKAIDTSFLAWLWSECLNLMQIFVIVCLVMLFNKIINFLRISDFVGFVLSPLLRFLGISRQATNVVIVGLVLGILYGSGVIIQAAKEGKMTHIDTFSTMSLMSLAHALIEDTILLALIGGSLWGLLGVRLVLAIIIGATINGVYSKFYHPESLEKGTA